jgi:hypothetical protein
MAFVVIAFVGDKNGLSFIANFQCEFPFPIGVNYFVLVRDFGKSYRNRGVIIDHLTLHCFLCPKELGPTKQSQYPKYFHGFQIGW